MSEDIRDLEPLLRERAEQIGDQLPERVGAALFLFRPVAPDNYDVAYISSVDLGQVRAALKQFFDRTAQ